MCGNHRADGSPVDHHHHDLAVFMPEVRRPRQWRRRAFLGDLGKGTFAFAVLAPAFIAACSDDTEDTTGADTTATGGTGTTTTARTTTADDADPTTTESAPTLTWARTEIGNVSAYVLVRGTEAAIVDTGVAGSADDIGETLAGVGLDYGAVTHVILTHLHPDHAGSIMEVMQLAGSATAYAGEDDIGGIDYDPITAAAHGDEVFGLEVIATPGHTDGHIAVIDHDAGLLVAGDALNAQDGGVQGPSPRFSTDIDTANESARRLAALSFNTLLVGHGDPIEDMADTAVAALAASL
jgi:glyoxylase-like metal-dependent hydrolase (beta-lactamase superfamily II)